VVLFLANRKTAEGVIFLLEEALMMVDQMILMAVALLESDFLPFLVDAKDLFLSEKTTKKRLNAITNSNEHLVYTRPQSS
jgi:hypothetical protein